jgi:hypothetical protein
MELSFSLYIVLGFRKNSPLNCGNVLSPWTTLSHFVSLWTTFGPVSWGEIAGFAECEIGGCAQR